MLRTSAVKLLWPFLVALALVAAACGNDDDGATEPTPSPAATLEPTASAEAPNGASTPAAESVPDPFELDVAAVEAAAAAWMEDARAPGLLLAAARGNEEPRAFSWGLSDIAAGEAMTTDSYVRIGSVTKPVTTAAVLSLADEGLVDLDTPVTAYLGDDWYGDYEHGPDITLRHLLGHTAGFVEYAFDPRFFILAADRLDEAIAPEDIVAFSTDHGPAADFETEYHYSTAGHIVAGMVIEAVTGNPAHAEIRSRILEPLGLENTYLPPGELPPEPIANGYNRGAIATAINAFIDIPDEARVSFMGSEYVATLGVPQEFLQSAGWTGGGLEAQIGDVPQMFRGLFTEGLVGDDSLAEMTTAGVNPEYGLGVGIDEIDGLLVYRHGGGTPGYRTQALYFPEIDLSLAAHTNLLTPEPDLDELLEALVPILVDSWGLGSK